MVATIVGTAGDDGLVGTPGDDVIVGGGGTDSVLGGDGDDVICGGPGPVRMVDGDPIFQYLSGGPGNDVLVGGTGDEVLTGSDGADLLIGRGGADYLSGDEDGQGADDVLRGGSGADTLNGGKGDDRLLGQADADWLADAIGDNILDGGGGADVLNSGLGNEALNGGAGVDTASYLTLLAGDGSSGHCQGVTADLGAGTASGSGFGADALEAVENLASGGGNDVLIGDSGPNVFYAGSPCYNNRTPHESVTGGGGRDRISFSTGTFGYDSPYGPVHVDLANGTAELQSQTGFPPVVLTLASIENATGTEYADVIGGDEGPNRLSAGSTGFGYSEGGDVIRGQGGNDILSGSPGADKLFGDEGSDKLLGRDGDDRLDGGSDTNVIDGGEGTDACKRPSRFHGALNCEV